MGKTKKKRKLRRKNRQKGYSIREGRSKDWTAPKMKFFTMPKLLPDDIPKETRLEIVRAIGAKAKEKFDQKYPGIATWFQSYDALYLLSYCAVYFVSQPEGVDPELSGQQCFFYHYLEIMQAFSLAQERQLTPKPLLQESVRLYEEMLEIGEAMQLQLLNIPPEMSADEELHAYRLRTDMMAHTTAVRNWAYPHQMQHVVFALASSIKEPFKTEYGIDPCDLMQLFFRLTEERNDLLNAHRDKLRPCIQGKNRDEIVEAYNKAFPENVPIDGPALDEIWKMAGRNTKNLIGMLITHADLKLDQVFSFTLEHAQSLLETRVPDASLESMLDKLAMKFGDLKDFKKEHIVLGNPVLSRPLIRVADRVYFSAVWGVMPHIALDLLEDLVWPTEALRNQYTDSKARFLEDEIERLFRTGFPNASIYPGSQWKDAQTGITYENDLTLVLDTFAIVVEAKSGSVTDPARRGAPRRMVETLRELIEEPSEQALRFITFLDQHRGENVLKTKRGITNVIDSSRIRYFIPLGVTLSQLGFISSNLKKLIDAKVTNRRLEELAPSMNLTDLECVFELLPSEIQKVHYLARRREFEAHMLYEGDELDLLAFYLDNGFNIGDAEYSGELVINMGMKSKELDPYFIGMSEGKTIQKPEVPMTRWWKDLLGAMSNKKADGWVETGFILLNSTKEDQEQFEKMFKKMMLAIKQGRTAKAHNWVLFSSGPERRRYLIAGYPYTTTDKDLRNEIMGEILSDGNVGIARGCAVIGVQLDRLDYPYSVFARLASTNLFDTLTLK